jgi:predicted nucleic acid-binding protein
MARRSSRAQQPPVAYLPDAIVLDCSVALAWYLEGESTPFTDSLLQAVPKMEIWVPALWILEFSNALFAAERRRRISSLDRTQIISQASLQEFKVDSSVMALRQVDEDSAEHDLTPYDAMYFELSRRRKLPLATLDVALVKAARTANVPLFTDLSLFPAT